MAIDAFTDTDGVLLTTHNSNWTNNAGTFVIQSNGLRGNASGETSARRTDEVLDANQYVQGHLTIGGDGVWMGIAARVSRSGAATYYGAYGTSGLVQFFRNVAGAWSQFGSDITTIASGSLIRIRTNGSDIYLDDDGVQVATVNDTSITVGDGGVTGGNAGGSTTFLDDFESGNLAAPVTPVQQTSSFAVQHRMAA